jgi:hypothetical protein
MSFSPPVPVHDDVANVMYATLRRAFCVALAALCTHAGAQQPPDPLLHVMEGLPELPGPGNAAPGHFGINPDNAEFGYASRLEKWSAKFGQYRQPNPEFKLNYGLLLSDKLGAGATFSRHSAFSEVVLNGVFAPQKNVRLRFTGAQLRGTDGFSLLADGDGVQQNSYLFNAQKYWNKYRFLSDLGLTAYSTAANSPPAVSEMPEGDAAPLAPGRKDGYLVNLGLWPTSRSRVELGREFSHLSYYLGDDARQASQFAWNRVKVSHYLDNCVRLQGRYSAGTETGRLDLNVARNNWSVNLSREQAGGGDNTAVMVGYTLPLGVKPGRSATCSGSTGGAPAFEPIVDASLARPAQLPRAPLLMQMQ